MKKETAKGSRKGEPAGEKKRARTVGKKPPLKTTVKSAPRPRQEPRVTEEEVRLTAYFLWLERGGGNGTPESDWAEAERKVKAGKGRGAHGRRT